MSMLAVAVALTGVLCVVNLLLTFGVIRRLKEGQGTSSPVGLPVPGAVVGEFEVAARDGRILSRESLGEGALVAFLSAGCGGCGPQIPRLLERAREHRGERIVAVVSGPEAEAAQLVEPLAGVADIVLEPLGKAVNDAFGVRGYPSFCQVADGVVTASSVNVAVLPAPSRS
ncbi:hypothetical protein [Nonomuraea sp. NPDC049141]|uniref:peroxiredoxin family protein n=1 Tax=Nonomuraea sp. NPDC049141 TaxID=3155500 RepID=UPI0033EAB375